MSLNALRKEIDALDAHLVALLNTRARTAIEIGRVKKSNGDPIYVPEREQAVLDHVRALNDGPIPDDKLLALYQQIINTTRQVEDDL